MFKVVESVPLSTINSMSPAWVGFSILLEMPLSQTSFITLPEKVFASLGAIQGFMTVNSRLKTWQQMENKSTPEVQPST